MWKAVIPKLWSFWIKTPFLYHQNFPLEFCREGGSGQQDTNSCLVTLLKLQKLFKASGIKGDKCEMEKDIPCKQYTNKSRIGYTHIR